MIQFHSFCSDTKTEPIFTFKKGVGQLFLEFINEGIESLPHISLRSDGVYLLIFQTLI